MLKDTDNFYLQKKEPLKSCLLALKEIILAHDRDITEAWKYGMPFFYFKGKMLCYLWADKKTQQPYLGIADGNKIDHPALIMENRKRMKIMLFDPEKDLPIKTIRTILKQAMEVRNG